MAILRISKKMRDRLEFAAVIGGFAYGILYPFLSPFDPWDYEQFILAGTGQSLEKFYYAPWTLPFYAFLGLFPAEIGQVIGFSISAAGFLLALHIFKGNKVLFFLSYPFFFSLYYGQMDGIFAASLAVMVLALRRGSAPVAALAWMMAAGKFYVGIPLGLGVWWCYAANNRVRAQVVALVALLTLVSFVAYPHWLPDLVARARAVAPLRDWSIDLWPVAGPVLLLLWVPVFLSRTRDYRWWVAAWALTVPYLHIHGLLHVLIQPIGPVGWWVQVNFLLPVLFGQGLSLQSYHLLLIPGIVYLYAWSRSWSSDWLSLVLARLRAGTTNPAQPTAEAA